MGATPSSNGQAFTSASAFARALNLKPTDWLSLRESLRERVSSASKTPPLLSTAVVSAAEFRQSVLQTGALNDFQASCLDNLYVIFDEGDKPDTANVASLCSGLAIFIRGDLENILGLALSSWTGSDGEISRRDLMRATIAINHALECVGANPIPNESVGELIGSVHGRPGTKIDASDAAVSICCHPITQRYLKTAPRTSHTVPQF
jgi:hypothetical protein